MTVRMRIGQEELSENAGDEPGILDRRVKGDRQRFQDLAKILDGTEFTTLAICRRTTPTPRALRFSAND
ncbi:hypothetical protein [Amycolatopsis sp. lyj-90]|uniref:hypothetical protein n=1 Tax=Amycolatopsis sp. lyj-90 TaxID=2789285 RepID=UPI00397A9CBE